MTVTLIVLLIITVLAIFILPFSRALMKDRAVLHENPLDKKFKILLDRINDLMMNGKGEITVFKDDPRMLNLFDKNHANMIINFYYSTGSLSITLKYKYFHVELVKKMQFDGMRHAEAFRQQDVANHFCEEASIALREHQIKVNNQRGLKDSSGEYIFSQETVNNNSENPVELVRGMYSEFTRDEKLAIVNIAQLIATADGSSISDFKNHIQFSNLLLNLQVNYSEVQNQNALIGESGVIELIKTSANFDKTILITTLMPYVTSNVGPVDERILKFYDIFERLGFSQEEVDNDIEKMMLLMQKFGVR